MQTLIRIIAIALFAIALAASAAAEFPGAYVGKADARDAAMSPNGESVVILKSGHQYGIQQREGWDEIVIKSTASGDITLTRDEEKWLYAWVDWPFDDLIVANGISYSIKNREWVAKTSLIGINPQSGEERVLSSSRQTALKHDRELPKLIGVDRDRREVILMVPKNGRTELTSVNVDTLETRMLDVGDDSTRIWYLNKKRHPVIKVQSSNSGAIDTYLRRSEGPEKWQTMFRHDRLGTPFRPITFLRDKLGFSVLARPTGAERVGLYEFDLKTGQFGRLIKENSTFDLSSAVVGTAGDILYTAYWEDNLRKDWNNPKDADRGRKISKAFGAQTNWSLIDTDDDSNNWLLYVSSPTRPGDFVAFHAPTKKLRKMSVSRPGLSSDSVTMSEKFSYSAADGTPLFGYFTPAMNFNGPTPLVVIPHGGPVSRDVMDWEPWAQYLSFRGYSVFQPQFRGSGGFGVAFERAGHKQWGRKMQTDISDGVIALERAGKVSPTLPRSILGASYGGYAALAAATLTPDQFQCAISLNGVSDLPAMLETYDRTEPIESFAYDIWVERMGDPEIDLDALKNVSPIHNVEGLTAQVFLIHSERDRIVDLSQSKRMYARILDEKKFAKFMMLENVGHSNFDEKTSTDLLFEINQFLTRCMPPPVQ